MSSGHVWSLQNCLNSGLRSRHAKWHITWDFDVATHIQGTYKERVYLGHLHSVIIRKSIGNKKSWPFQIFFNFCMISH